MPLSLKPKRRTQREFREQLDQSLEALEINLEAYERGRAAGWLGVASQLYVLLCDQAGPLVDRVSPELSLHPLMQDVSQKSVKYLLYLPKVSFGPDGMALDLFDLEKPALPFAEWLEQTVAVLNVGNTGIYVTIRDLIIEVRNQAGPGHFTPTVRETAQATTGFKIVEKGMPGSFHEKCIVAIGKYVLLAVREHLRKHEAGSTA